VRDLEMAVKQQSAELEKGKALRQKVTQEKGQLEIQVATLGAELQEASRRSVLKEKEEQSEQYEQALQKLRATHEADLSHYQQEAERRRQKQIWATQGDMEKAQQESQIQDLGQSRASLELAA